MPYIIVTETPSPLDQQGVEPTIDRTAVATLDEARWNVADAIGRAEWSTEAPGQPWDGAFTPDERGQADEAVSESGGTVGPLPDGTVIEVRSVEWSALADHVADERDQHIRDSPDAILAAFNAA
jgi:hypothetical protein